jgi:hypothetical protein
MISRISYAGFSVISCGSHWQNQPASRASRAAFVMAPIVGNEDVSTIIARAILSRTFTGLRGVYPFRSNHPYRD